MNCVVVGQGAIGLLWYHHLLKHQLSTSNHILQNLSLLASKHQNRAQKQYQFTDLENHSHQGELKFTHLKDLQVATLVIICVKSYQVKSVIDDIATHLNPNCAVLLAHNGLGTLDELPKGFINKHNIYALLTTHGCLRNAPLNITHTGNGESSIGLLSKSANQEHQKNIVTLLNSALAPVIFEENIIEKQWLKLAINCVINPITAINNIDNGLVNDVKFCELIEKLLAEVVAVGAKQQIKLDKEALQKTVHGVALATAKNCSSMRCDVLAHRQTEVDYINGYIHRLGEKHRIATPQNTKLWQAVKKLS